jgi:hypothetical protein
MATLAASRAPQGCGRAPLQFLRRAWIRRLLVAVMLCTFVPVVSAMVACQVHCALERGEPHKAEHSASEAWSGDRAAGGADGRLAPQAALSHSGPCHLAVVPAAAGDGPRPACGPVEAAWLRGEPARYASLVWPPPEHRPRA